MTQVLRVRTVAFKALGWSLAGAVALVLAIVFGVWGCQKSNDRLPPPEKALSLFESRRSDFMRLATLISENRSDAVPTEGGYIDLSRITASGELARDLGIKFALVREDGAIDFAIWGHGGAAGSDSYLGLRYWPEKHRTDVRLRWSPTIVTALDSSSLPKSRGTVATGLYVLPVQPEWYIFRYEYQE